MKIVMNFIMISMIMTRQTTTLILHVYTQTNNYQETNGGLNFSNIKCNIIQSHQDNKANSIINHLINENHTHISCHLIRHTPTPSISERAYYKRSLMYH